MQNTNVIDLGEVRSLLDEWERVRAAMAAGRVTGFHVAVRTVGGQESIFMGGAYKSDTQAALRVNLRASAHRAMQEDEPPLFQVSQF